MTLQRKAIAFLRGAASEDGGTFALTLASAVLRGAAELPSTWTRLALEVREADPSWSAKAVTLAVLVLEEAVSEHDETSAGGGQR